MEKLSETRPSRTCSDRKGSLVTAQWDDRYERGYGKLMERDCERERYRTIGKIVAALPAHSSLLDVGCGIGGTTGWMTVFSQNAQELAGQYASLAEELERAGIDAEVK